MKRSCYPERAGDTEIARDRVQASVAVEIEILAGVEYVESGDPESDGGGEEQDAGIERAANGDPGSGGGNAKRESKNQMRPAGESFGVGIKEQDGERHGREPEREAIELCCGKNKDGAGDDYEGRDECGG